MQGAEGNEENHAIALVLGRLYVYALVMNIPDRAVAGLLTLFRLAGIDIGQKHHHCGAISSFAGIVSRMCIEGVSSAFADKPRNLQHPSCWRLICDGVTLRNRVTVTVVLICFTSAEGDIEVEYLGASRCGSRSDATGTGKGILELLEKTLKISDSNAVCYSSTGLPFAFVAASSQGHEGEAARGCSGECSCPACRLIELTPVALASDLMRGCLTSWEFGAYWVELEETAWPTSSIASTGVRERFGREVTKKRKTKERKRQGGSSRIQRRRSQLWARMQTLRLIAATCCH